MAKKLAILLLAAIMSLGVFGLAGCNNASLADYKATKSQALQEYADAKGVENYCTDGWQAVCKAVTDGKAEISEATSKPAVDTAFKGATDAIDDIDKEGKGMFYTLQEAYDGGLLTIEDLHSIANYHADGTSSTAALSAENVSAIKEVAAKNMRESELTPVEDANADDFSIIKYYGTYNGSVAFMVNDPYNDYPDVELDIDETIAGVLFHYTNPNRIIVWKQ